VISESTLCVLIRREIGAWDREEPKSEYIRGLLYGFSQSLLIVLREAETQKNRIPGPPCPMTKEDAAKLYKHLETISHMLGYGDRARAERKARAVLESYREQARLSAAVPK
jgi:hypothetical protein